MEKSQSSNQLAGNNKYWSFKSKFRRSQSTTPSLGSTFYLTEELVVGNESSSGLVWIIFSSFNFVIYSILFSKNSVNGCQYQKLCDVFKPNCGFMFVLNSASQLDSNSTYTDSASPSSQRSGPPLNAPALPLPPRPPSVASQQNFHNERRNSSAMRPHSPPPPPPPVPKRNGPQKDKEKVKSSSSSWYAECGLFDSSNLGKLCSEVSFCLSSFEVKLMKFLSLQTPSRDPLKKIPSIHLCMLKQDYGITYQQVPALMTVHSLNMVWYF